MGENKRREIIIAIDFGATYSGFGFAALGAVNSADIHVFRGWGRGQGFSFYKTPTCVLLTEEGEFYRFGHAALETYAKYLARNDGPEMLFFDRFKLLLYNAKNLDKETRVTAANGRSVCALDLFAVCLEYLKKVAMETINSTLNKNADTARYQASDVAWVLTVPAIWEPAAKEFMREAAYIAGLASQEDPEQLLIALEPEAASFYCRGLEMSDFVGETGEQLVNDMLRGTSGSYMVIDNGGGTLDITSHQLQKDGTVKEIHCPTGGQLGGMCVDQEFIAMLKKILGDDFITQFIRDYPNDWQKIMSDFEIQKRAEHGIDNEEISIVLPYNFVNAYSQVIGTDDNINESMRLYFREDEVTLRDGYMYVNLDIIKKFYQPVADKTIDLIKSLLNKERLGEVETLFLVGGFSQSVHLRRAIVEAFPNKRILTPRESELAIIKGAVMFAQNPNLLSARVMARTYGIDINEKFETGKHPETKRSRIDGVDFCEDVFDILVKEDEEVRVGEKRSFFFSPVHPLQTLARLRFFSTNNKSIGFTTDAGVVAENVQFEVVSPDTSQGLSRKIELDVYFGGTEIKVSAIDVTSGSSAKAALRLVTKTLA
ncbi:heat shock 70 kDa protein 12A [Nematostella vectensis]|nr:heat shock 70 kDa protein 12A [Nematostella vectensis]